MYFLVGSTVTQGMLKIIWLGNLAQQKLSTPH